MHCFSKKIFKNKKILLLFVSLSVLLPVFTFAQEKGLVPECTRPGGCGFAEFVQLINNVVSFLVKISIPISAGVIAWAGFNMIMDGGNSTKRRESIEMIKKVIIGFVIMLAAWIIVSTLLDALLSSQFKDAVQIVK